jgi:putative NADH-flavin reductase
MKVILFGATGMVGQGTLRECLRDDAITQVLSVGRSASGQQHAKLTEIIRDDFVDYSDIESQLTVARDGYAKPILESEDINSL